MSAPFQARKRSGIITVQEVQEDDLPLNVERRGDGTLFVKNGVHASEINCTVGDLIRIDDPNDTYPIDSEYFTTNFDRIE